jgi:hypothetical protein
LVQKADFLHFLSHFLEKFRLDQSISYMGNNYQNARISVDTTASHATPARINSGLIDGIPTEMCAKTTPFADISVGIESDFEWISRVANTSDGVKEVVFDEF